MRGQLLGIGGDHLQAASLVVQHRQAFASRAGWCARALGGILLAEVDGQTVLATGHGQKHLGQQLGIEQSTMQGAMRIVDAIAIA